MNCDCIKDLEAKVAAHYEAEHKVPVTAECRATGLFMSEGMGLEVGIKIDFSLTADKPGYRKGKQTFVRARYCPFCGKKAGAAPKEKT